MNNSLSGNTKCQVSVTSFDQLELKSLPNKTKSLLLQGNPGLMIVEFVKQNDADLVVMGSRGLNGLKELFLGSVSHYVVQKAPCPVLIVK